MEFDLGALGLCKRLCFVESLVFSCLVDWMVYLGILRLFWNGRPFYGGSHLEYLWIFISFVKFDRHFLLKPVKDQKLRCFFFLQDFELQILLQLRSVSWYFPYTKEVFFFRRIFLLLVSITSGKTLRNSSWFLFPRRFFGGGAPTSISPPLPCIFFWSPKEKQLGKKFVLWKFRQANRKKLAVEISPVNLGGESLPCWGWVWWKGNRSSVVCHGGVSGLVGSFRIGHV